MPPFTEGMKKNWVRLKELQDANRVKKLNEEYEQIVKAETADAEKPKDSGGFFSSMAEKIFGGDESRKRIAASKNNISNKQLNNMLEKNLSRKQAENLRLYGTAKEKLWNLSHLTGRDVDAGGKEIGVSAEKVAEYEKCWRSLGEAIGVKEVPMVTTLSEVKEPRGIQVAHREWEVTTLKLLKKPSRYRRSQHQSQYQSGYLHN